MIWDIPEKGHADDVLNTMDSFKMMCKNANELMKQMGMFAYQVRSAIGDPMPRTTKSTIDDGIIDAEISDEAFVRKMARANAGATSIERMANYARIIAMLGRHRKSFEAKRDKMSERLKLSRDSGSNEFNVCTAKLARNNEIVRVLSKRIGITAARMYKERSAVARSLLNLSSSVYEIVGPCDEINEELKKDSTYAIINEMAKADTKFVKETKGKTRRRK